jgi:4-amino-4-deoxy-L-arabinose transferase-like glycosyltransferase
MRSAARTTKIVIALSSLAVAARFVLIDQPYIDKWSWRQSDVAAIARNFLHNGFHFARPQIDWAGDQPGYVGTEFPILPFIAALCYKIFGVHEWIGRVQAVIFFALSLPFLFLIVRQIFGPIAAVWALFFYSFAPLNVMTSRCFMPDVPSLSLALIALFLFIRWIENRQRIVFFASAIALSLSILIKVTSVLIGAPILYLLVAELCERRKFFAQQNCDGHRLPLQMLALFAAIALLPSVIWYWHAYQIAQKFYPFHLFGEGGIRIESFAWYWDIAQRTVTSSLTPLLSVLALIGFFITPRGRFTNLFHWWFIAIVLFIIVAGYGNRHPWYQLPLVPIAAAFAGHFCSRIMALPIFAHANSFAALLMRAGLSLVMIAFAACALGYTQIFYEPVAAPFRNAGLELKKITPRDALILAADDGNPTLFYYAERKGWHFPEKNGIWQGGPRDSEQAIVDLEQLRKRGASYFVFQKDAAWWLDYYGGFAKYLNRSADLVNETNDFKIYRLPNKE